MTIVVTGAAGFIGGAVLSALDAAGRDHLGVDRAPVTTASTRSLQAELTHRTGAVSQALAEAEAVIHLAGCPGVRDRSPDIAARRHRDNVLATAAVLDATPRHTPLVVLSSSSVYGGARDRGGVLRASREGDRLRPRGGYAESKVATEAVCARRAAAGGHVLVVRPFTVLGEGQRADMAVHRWAVEAAAGRPMTILGDPGRTRDVTDVRDVARLLLLLLDRGADGTVNLGCGRPRALREIAAAVAAAVGVPTRLRLQPAADVEVPHTWADTRRLRRLAGTVPTTDLADVVARAVRSTAPAEAVS